MSRDPQVWIIGDDTFNPDDLTNEEVVKAVVRETRYCLDYQLDARLPLSIAKRCALHFSVNPDEVQPGGVLFGARIV